VDDENKERDGDNFLSFYFYEDNIKFYTDAAKYNEPD